MELQFQNSLVELLFKCLATNRINSSWRRHFSWDRTQNPVEIICKQASMGFRGHRSGTSVIIFEWLELKDSNKDTIGQQPSPMVLTKVNNGNIRNLVNIKFFFLYLYKRTCFYLRSELLKPTRDRLNAMHWHNPKEVQRNLGRPHSWDIYVGEKTANLQLASFTVIKLYSMTL